MRDRLLKVINLEIYGSEDPPLDEGQRQSVERIVDAVLRVVEG